MSKQSLLFWEVAASIYDKRWRAPDEVTQGQVALVKKYVPSGDKILDLGCATGRMTTALADEGYKVIGADISPKLIYQALALAQERDIQFLVCDAGCPLPFIDYTFDAVVLFQSVLEYLDDSAERQIWAREMHRIIRPGGILIIDIVAELPATDTFEENYWIKRLSDRDSLFYDCLTESKCVKHLYTEDELWGLLSGFVLQFLRTNTKCQLVEQGPKRIVIGRRCLE